MQLYESDKPSGGIIRTALERSGVTAYRRRIDGVMLEQGMTSTYARKRFKPHRTRVNEVELANLLNRKFGNYTPHTHLASDLMYMRLGGWSYVCLPVNLANREHRRP